MRVDLGGGHIRVAEEFLDGAYVVAGVELNFGRAHFAWVTLLMVENIPFNPLNVRFLGANRVMLDAQDLADLIEESGFRIGDDL